MAPSTRRISTRSWQPTRPVPRGTSKALRLAARGPPCLGSQATVFARRAAFWSSVHEEATMNLFLAYAYHDEDYASGPEDNSLGPGARRRGAPLALVGAASPAADRFAAARVPRRDRDRFAGIPGLRVAEEGTGRADDPSEGHRDPRGCRRGGYDGTFLQARRRGIP